MKKFRMSNPALIVLIIMVAFASLAQAQATRTWVSGVGDDANPCSRTAPCKTFAGAISKTAAGGEINAIDDGGFGAVTITKAITIDGSGHLASVLASLVNGVTINAGSGDTITLRNLDINGVGNGLTGVNILSAKSVVIEGCRIYGFRNGTGRAIHDNANVNTNQLFVNDSFISDSLGGIGVTGSAAGIRAYIRNSRIQNNAGFGILGSNTSTVSVQSSIITGNAGDGFKVDVSATGVVVGCLITSNVGGVIASGSAGIFLADTTVINNSSGASGNIVTFGNNNVRNNGANNTLAASVGQQ